ncbi:amino acid adenylation domain-containing protein [Salegentibacter sp. UBA1130]|uniref:amino acid adenylation domain-containing protein n=1 Tax=Salegentibacter sp. UBA1130 TaxID=1947451 RepID=UPI00257E9475|nr:amino acid adenylation domain-containing protein [Salegentibacter sp. UBA1130]
MKLTLPQKDIYYEQLLFAASPIYNIGAKIRIEGLVDRKKIDLAYQSLIKQHDSFRIILRLNKFQSVSFEILDDFNESIKFVDFSDEDDGEVKALEFMQNRFKKPFKLYNEKLHCFILIKVEDNIHYLFSVYHHIITDGWGTSLMFQRLVQNYNEILNNSSVITNYPYSYKDYVVNDKAYRDSQFFERDKFYWKEKFSDLPEQLFDKIDSNVELIQSSRKELIIKNEDYGELIQIARRMNASTFHLLLASFFSYFALKYNNNDFAIGLPVLNRPNSKFKKTVGLFMGVTPFRKSVDINEKFENLVKSIKSEIKKDYRYQRYPLGELINDLNLYSTKDQLFNVTLSYEKQNYSPNFEGTKTKVIPLTHETERVGLAIYVREFDEKEDIKIDFDYNLNYFNERTIEPLVNHYKNFLNDIINNSESLIKDLNYLDNAEKNLYLERFNSTNINFDLNLTITNLFENQANIFPHKTAVRDEYRKYTYSQLQALSTIVANNLSQLGNREKTPIVIIANRSVQLITVILGVLKSGRSFIPVDPELPAKRIDYIIKDSGADIVFTDESRHFKLAGRIIGFTEILEVGNKSFSFTDLSNSNESAYIIYTSGSTGKPKGVEVKHKSLTNFLYSMQMEPGFNSNDVLFAVTTISFDISLLELFLPLISGGEIYIAGRSVLKEPSYVIKEIEKVEPTIIQATPSFFQMLYNFGWKGEKNLKVLCGGEAISEALAKSLISSVKEIWNMYGPTETTIWSSIKKLSTPRQVSNIGKPIRNTQIYILNDYGKLAPVGINGNIYIGGEGLSVGYYGNPELTNKKYSYHSSIRNRLLFDTGDIGRWNEEGDIILVGRKDNMIKLRGYRIELGEIEVSINNILEVNNSIVVLKKSKNPLLVAYIDSSSNFKEQELKKELENILPKYMVPSVIVSIDKLPKTPNNKVDRKLLSEMPLDNRIENVKEEKLTSTELRLIKIWNEIFQVQDKIKSSDENFFELGGHSLLAAKLIYRIEEEFAVSLKLEEVFQNFTIKTLSRVIDYKEKNHALISNVETKEYYQLTPSQRNIWYACQLDSGNKSYNLFSMFKVSGHLDLIRLEEAILELMNNYEILRTNFITIDGDPVQKIHHNLDSFRIESKVFEKRIAFETYLKNFSENLFNLESDILLKTVMVTYDNEKYLLFVTHHIIMDGISIENFIEKLSKVYSDSETISFSEIQFKNYSQTLNKEITETLVKNKNFWENYLEDTYKIGMHPKKEEIDQLLSGRKISFKIKELEKKALQKFSKQNRVTLFSVLYGIIALEFHREFERNNFCLGTILNDQQFTKGLEIGMYAKTLPIRVNISKNISFLDFVKFIHRDFLDVREHSNLPESFLLKNLIDTLVVYQVHGNYENLRLGEAFLSKMNNSKIISRFPLVITFFEQANSIIFEIDFNINYVSQGMANQIGQNIISISKQIIKKPNILVNELTNKFNFQGEKGVDIDFNF